MPKLPPKPQLIVQDLSQPFSLTQVLKNPIVLPQLRHGNGRTR